MLQPLRILFITLSLSTSSVIAATLIDIQGAPGGSTQVMIDGSKSRIGMGDQGYVLIDNDRQTMFTVAPAQKQIIDMSGDLSSSGDKSAPRIRTELLSRGNGPTIAGYSTEMFSLKANGKNCGTLFGSKAAMNIAGIASLFNSMKAMIDKQKDAMGAYAALMDDCTRANMDFATQANKVGVPMRMQDSRGNTLSEIKYIDTDAMLPADTFVLPEGYQMVSMNEQMNGNRQSVSQAPRQMQQYDRVPPEAIKQMKRYQEMMKQYR